MDCKDLGLGLVGEARLVRAVAGVGKALAWHGLTRLMKALVTMLLHAKVCLVGGLGIHAGGIGSLVLVSRSWWGMGLECSWLGGRG